MPSISPQTYKALREAAGLSQREVERRAGWGTHGRLSLIERGIPPTETEHKALMSVLMAAVGPTLVASR